MQEAFGGTFMLKLFMVFFIIYVAFIAVALNFAKTYRIKNYVINTLEQHQYEGKANDPALLKLDSYLDNVPYTVSNELVQKKCNYDDKAVYHGVCIVPEGNKEAPYYRVIVYFVAEFPLFDLNITVPVSGETKVIYVK